MYFFIFYYQNQKGTSNKSVPEKFEPKNFKNQKGTSNKSVPENYFFIFVIHRHTLKYIITLCIPKLL